MTDQEHQAPRPPEGAPPRLSRGFGFGSALSLAFADVSPIVALYAIFTLGLFAAGPAFFWAFPVVLIGQLAVAAVFGELASRWPYAGSVYQWARHVRGTSWGWTAAWAYMWGLTIALSTLAVAGSGFLLGVFGIDEPSALLRSGVAIAIVLAGTLANMVGRTVLKVMVVASIIAELLGSIGLGTILLLFHQKNSIDTLFAGVDLMPGGIWASGPMLLAVAYVGWSFLGFEAAGSIAEEVEDPERNVPKAIILALVLVALTVMYTSAAVILAIPNIATVVGEASSDPVTDTLVAAFGEGIGRPLLIMFVIGFLSSFLAVQAAVSRAIWGAARDRGLPGSRVLQRLSGRERLPVNAIGLTAVVAIVLVLVAGTDFYSVLVNFTTIGFYIAFGVPVIAAAIARATGRWQPGAFSLGRWGAPITYFAAAWLVFQTTNVAWPRDIPGAPWYIVWSMVLTTVILGIVGVVVYAYVRKNIQAPIGERLEEVYGAEEAP